MKKLFTEHPASVNETYFTHLKLAVFMGLDMMISGLMGIIHGLLPFLFTTVISDCLGRCVAIFKSHNRKVPGTE